MPPFSQGMDLDSFPPLLSLGFSSPTVDHEEPLSFGTLLACLNMALSNLGPVSATSVKLRTCRAISYGLNVQGAHGEAWSQLFDDLFAIPRADVINITRSPSDGACISHTSPWSQPFPE